MFQDRNQTTKEIRKALDGVDEVIARQLGLDGAADLHRLSLVRELSCAPRGLDGVALARALLERIESNWRSQPQPPRTASRENWRWAKQLRLSAANTSAEKLLEKRIARELGDDWINQVPTLSGVMDSVSERHCNLDLVHRLNEGEYEFIELKIGSDNPVYAAAELVKYALVYVFSRRHAGELGYAPQNELLRAHTVRLRVLAPAPYYVGFELRWLESALTQALHGTAHGETEFDFRFETIDASATTAEQCVTSRRLLTAQCSAAAGDMTNSVQGAITMTDGVTLRRVCSSAEPAFGALLAIYAESIAVSERKSAEQLAEMVTRPEYCFLAAMRGAAVVGFAVAVELRGTDAALLEYMAVAESERGQGVGARLFRATAALPQLADRFLLIEVDSTCDEAEDRAERMRRKAFYARLGARELDGVRYRMPRVAEAEPPEMELMVFRAERPTTLDTVRVRAWVECVYAQVYGVTTSEEQIDATMSGLPERVMLK